jgi:Zn-dependent peptidase ImmA (M78 family)
VNGVIGSNTHRKLDANEFRGFALAEELAPVVFMNGREPKEVQSFVLPYLLAHLAVGESALCDADLRSRPTDTVERWCHAVTLELLVPLEELRQEVRVDALHAVDADADGDGDGDGDPDEDDGAMSKELDRLAKRFKVSRPVVLRRLHDADVLGREQFEEAVAAEHTRLEEQRANRPRGGGNFYNTQPVRMSKRFTRALLSSTRDGQTPSSDAARMLGFRSEKTLNELSRRLGI